MTWQAESVMTWQVVLARCRELYQYGNSENLASDLGISGSIWVWVGGWIDRCSIGGG